MKTLRIRSIAVGLSLLACLLPLPSRAGEANEFTSKDLRIALLLDTLGSVVEARDRDIAAGIDPKDAHREARARSVTIIKNINELTTSKHLIDLLEAESAQLQDKGLRAAHPTIRRLAGLIEALKPAN